MIEITWQYDPDAPARRAEPATAEEAFFSLQRGNRAFRGPRSRRRARPLRHPGGCRGTRIRTGSGHRAAPDAQCRAIGLRGRPSAVGTGLPSRPTTSSRCAWQATCSTEHLLAASISRSPTCRRCVRSPSSGTPDAERLERLWTRISTQPVMSACRRTFRLRGIVDAVTPAVRAADMALRAHYGASVVDRPGFSDALLDASVVLNTAIAGDAVRRIFADHLHEGLGVAFGSMTWPAVWSASQPARRMETRPVPPPGPDETAGFLEQVVTSVYIRRLLEI